MESVSRFCRRHPPGDPIRRTKSHQGGSAPPALDLCHSLHRLAASLWRAEDRPMIETVEQYGKAQAELRQLEDRLQRLRAEHPAPAMGLTKAGVRKLTGQRNERVATTRR